MDKRQTPPTGLDTARLVGYLDGLNTERLAPNDRLELAERVDRWADALDSGDDIRSAGDAAAVGQLLGEFGVNVRFEPGIADRAATETGSDDDGARNHPTRRPMTTPESRTATERLRGLVRRLRDGPTASQ